MTLKQQLQNFVFPIGSTQKIFRGYLKGFKIIISENSLWSPLKGGWEPSTQQIMVNVLEKGQIAYDLGANNGLHGLLLATIVGETGAVYNFEPLPENLTEIDFNFKINKIHNYFNVPKAVSDQTGFIEFKMGEHYKQGKIVTDQIDRGNLIQVPSISLDDFIAEGNPRPDFIKIDIEGAEGKALNGFVKNIEQCFPRMVIELHHPEADREVGQFLKFFNYQAFRFEPFKKLFFEKVINYDAVFPTEGGVWGTLFCIGPNDKLENYRFSK